VIGIDGTNPMGTVRLFTTF